MRPSFIVGLDRTLTCLLVAASLVGVVTCSGASAAPPPLVAAPHGNAESSPASPGAPETTSNAGVSPPRAEGVEPPAVADPFGSFRTALNELRAGQRKEPVRVLWLGDSHTSADFTTDVVRGALWQRYGVGGPGFVRLGVQPYRHARVRLEHGGRWQRRPEQPSRRSLVADGVFGLCGMRSVPEAGAWASVKLRGSDLAADAEVRFTLLYRLPKGAELGVRLGKKSLVLDETTEGFEPPGSSIRRVLLTGLAADELRVERRAGAPEVFGVYVEGSEPGVVLDTCGIEGARVATALAWDESAWQAEVRARRPDLLVLAFGTNEAFDDGRVERYGPELVELVRRVRAASPQTACWIFGPPDAADREGGTKARVLDVTAVQRRAAEELGCGFVSGLDLMGGEGSFGSWMSQDPPLARRDRIHLTPPGYERLGTAAVDWLLPAPAPASDAPPAAAR